MAVVQAGQQQGLLRIEQFAQVFGAACGGQAMGQAAVAGVHDVAAIRLRPPFDVEAGHLFHSL